MVHRVPALDVLRLIAVLGVLAFHYGFSGPLAAPAVPELRWLGHYGFMGVPVFFVISGFVIAYSAEGRSAREFAIARFVRIYPTFVLCMTLTFLVLLVFGAPNFRASLGTWAANLTVVAPGGYLDSAYWSLVVEIIFYAWFALLIRVGWLHRLDIVVAIWLALSVLNEMTVDWNWAGKLLLTDYSGFFATGILIYQLHKRRLEARVVFLLAASIVVTVYQATHNLGWLRTQTGAAFDDTVVGAITMMAIFVIMIATRIKRLPAFTLAIGGLTYPLYLLHQMMGYVAFQHVGTSATAVGLVVTAIVALSWVIWRYIEPALHQLVKGWLRKNTHSIVGSERKAVAKL
jgi:peptidoglycan/LPS O-acetylase OafA/YrhL